MYSKTMGNGYANRELRRDPYRRPLYIPPNYHGTAMKVSPSSPYTSLPEADALLLPQDEVPEEEKTTKEEEPSKRESSEAESKEDMTVSASPSLLQGLLSGHHFPFGHGLGYEELLLLGLILFLMREGEENQSDTDDRTLALVLLGALLFLG